jgi:alginate O-acetyltransferase complex protein AlgI
MLFCSAQYFLFFAAVFVVYWALPWHRLRVWLLLGASFYFYASWNHWLAVLIVVSTAIDYLIALRLEADRVTVRRKLLLSASLVMNLGLLAYFKYANFFLDSLAAVLHQAGLSASLPTLSVILPIGISFYTFEAINYTVDVYRGQVRAERSLPNFMLFILFFPHLVAGPIVRARDFLPQTHRRKHWNWARMQLGVEYFLMGLCKKLVIADRMAAFVDPVFATPERFGADALWVAVLAYALQIYGDFSGYTDMALGSAHLLGYRLAQNFNMPYLATSIADFWRRWHMSLSSWLRDYLFIPLGGSRGGLWPTCRNLLITMALGGLWHGASWTFVIWGVFHGLLLVAHRLFHKLCDRLPWLDELVATAPGAVLCGQLTFLSVCAGWVLFRAQTLTAARAVFEGILTQREGWSPPLPPSVFFATAAVVAVCHAAAASGLRERLLDRLPAPVLGSGYAVVLTLILVLAPDSGKAFIYFQF